MNTFIKFTRALQRALEATAKARANSVLLGMGREKVEELGYSYEALRIGSSAWPWRKTTHNSAEETETRVQFHLLKSFSDKQPNDLGIVPNEIEQAERHGRAGIDYNTQRWISKIPSRHDRPGIDYDQDVA